MQTKEDYITYSLIAVLFILVIGLVNNFNIFSSSSKITGAATTANAETSATIANYFALSLPSNVSTDGVIFDIQTIPATNSNATANYNGTSETEFYLIVATDSNVNVDFCIKANGTLVSGANEIALGNYTYANSTSNSITAPSTDLTVITTSFVNTDVNIAAGSVEYFRFWLSVNSFISIH